MNCLMILRGTVCRFSIALLLYCWTHDGRSSKGSKSMQQKKSYLHYSLLHFNSLKGAIWQNHRQLLSPTSIKSSFSVYVHWTFHVSWHSWSQTAKRSYRNINNTLSSEGRLESVQRSAYLKRRGCGPYKQSEGLGHQGCGCGQGHEEQVASSLWWLISHPVHYTTVHYWTEHL